LLVPQGPRKGWLKYRNGKYVLCRSARGQAEGPTRSSLMRGKCGADVFGNPGTLAAFTLASCEVFATSTCTN
jgi:hypothetical protein